MELSGIQNRASLVWLAQAVTGILLIVLLVVHLIANHFFVPGGLQTYQDVVRYLSNPVIFILEISFLVVVTSHAILGVRAILIDRGIAKANVSRMDTRLWFIGALIIIYGIVLSVLIIT